MRAVINYRSSGTGAPVDAPWGLPRAALWCGGIPLGIGGATFACWVVTRSPVFEMVGFFDLLAGPLFVLAGLICLGLHISIERRRTAAIGGQMVRLGPWPLLLLLSNFPAAAAVLYAVGWVEHTAALTIVNGTNAVATVTVRSDAGTFTFGPLLPGAKQARTVHANVGNYHYAATTADGRTVAAGDGSFGDDDSHPPGTPYDVDVSE